MIKAGEVWSYDAYYLDGDEFKRKYLLALFVAASGDVVHRLLTSRQHGRPMDPSCFHGMPYPGFYLGILGNELGKESWLDLRECDDMDSYEFAKLFREGVLKHIGTLKSDQFRDALDCAANADDTTRRQRSAILDAKNAIAV